MNTNTWLVQDYTEWDEHSPDSKIRLKMIFNQRDLFILIDQAKKDNSKIVISEIGDCLIDWS